MNTSSYYITTIVLLVFVSTIQSSDENIINKKTTKYSNVYFDDRPEMKKKPWRIRMTIKKKNFRESYATQDEAVLRVNKILDDHGLPQRNKNTSSNDDNRIEKPPKKAYDYKGVTYHKIQKKNPWRATYYTLDGETKHLGYFDTPERAAQQINAMYLKDNRETPKQNLGLAEVPFVEMKKKSSKYIGVCNNEECRTKPWRVNVTTGTGERYYGSFATEDEAGKYADDVRETFRLPRRNGDLPLDVNANYNYTQIFQSPAVRTTNRLIKNFVNGLKDDKEKGSVKSNKRKRISESDNESGKQEEEEEIKDEIKEEEIKDEIKKEEEGDLSNNNKEKYVFKKDILSTGRENLKEGELRKENDVEVDLIGYEKVQGMCDEENYENQDETIFEEDNLSSYKIKFVSWKK